jgi:hypothetical protein
MVRRGIWHRKKSSTNSGRESLLREANEVANGILAPSLQSTLRLSNTTLSR